MARKSSLTEDQKAEIRRRLLEGESVRAVARAMKLPETTVRRNNTAQTAEIKAVANQIVNTEKALRALPIAAQRDAETFASRLLALQDSTFAAAANGMAVSHRLSGISRLLVEQIDDGNPLESLGSLKSIALLTRIANDSAQIGVALLNANRERMPDGADKGAEPDFIVEGGLPD